MVNATLLHPDYEHVFFDDATINDFLERGAPEYRAAYYQLPPTIQRFDFLRYLAIYSLGGFYLDLDVYLARRLDPLLDHECVFPFEELTLSRYLRQRHRWDWEVGNYAFGAEAGHPFIRAVIINCIRGLKDPQWSAEMTAGIPAPFRAPFIAPNATGPGLVTRTLAEERSLRGSVTVVFPHDVRDEATWHRFGDYGVHLMTAAWRQTDGFVRRRLGRVWETSARRRFALESQGRGAQRNGEWTSQFPAEPAATASFTSQDIPCQRP
jgi:hypothetical protein